MNDDKKITYAIDNYLGVCSGTRVSVHLNPGARHVYSCAIVGSGSPDAVWHRRHRTLLADIGQDLVPDALEAWLREHEEVIAAMCDAYEGEGRWSDAADDLDQKIERAWQESDVARFWDAGAYFEPARLDVLTELLADASVSAAVAREVADGMANDAHLDPADVRAWMEGELRRLAEDDDEDADDRERARKLLVECDNAE